jgi:hypothetical protein
MSNYTLYLVSRLGVFNRLWTPIGDFSDVNFALMYGKVYDETLPILMEEDYDNMEQFAKFTDRTPNCKLALVVVNNSIQVAKQG